MRKRAIDSEIEETQLIAQAQRELEGLKNASAQDIANAIDDNNFCLGGDHQWKPEALAIRRRLGFERPVVTWDRLGVFTARIINEARSAKPAIKITASDTGTQETADVIQAKIRQIEYESDADIAYDTSSEQQIKSGRGFYQITLEYEKGSFNQVVRIIRIPNQFGVFLGPSSKYDNSDMNLAFKVSNISCEEHKALYPDSRLEAANFYNDVQNPVPLWIGLGEKGQEVQVAERWERKVREQELVFLNDGTTMPKQFFANAVKMAEARGIVEIPEVIDERKELMHKVCQYTLNGIEVLEYREWLGSTIPIIPVWGRETFADGKRHTVSLIRPAKDPQRTLNIAISTIVELTMQTPKVPYVAAAGQIEGFEKEWAAANNTPFAVLMYNPIDINGTVLPPPQRIQSEAPIMALSALAVKCEDAIKSGLGIFDASLGERSNESSGIAIAKRQQQSDIANFHFIDNQARSRKRAGEIIVELLALLEDGSAREWTVRDEDGKTRKVPLNQRYKEKGKELIHEITSDYGVVVSTGPSFQNQKDEAFNIYSEIAKADPRFMEIAGDKLFRNLNAPGADAIAERYEKTLPPALQEQKEGEQEPDPQMLIGEITKLQQENQQLQVAVEGMTAEKEAKVIENESRERIEAQKLELERERLALENEQFDKDLQLQYAKLAATEDATALKAQTEAAFRIDDRADRIAAEEKAEEKEEKKGGDEK